MPSQTAGVPQKSLNYFALAALNSFLSLLIFCFIKKFQAYPVKFDSDFQPL